MNDNRKLGFWGLVALIFGLMVGVGIFNLPQNMAHSSSVGGVVVSWCVTAAGMLLLVMAFKWLSDRYPEYNAGVYEYAQAGFGEYAGFNAAWGYWLCTAFSNVAYAVMLNDACGVFFPVLLRHGLATVVFCSVLIWAMYWVVASGMQTAKIINNFLAGVKIFLLIFIVGVFFSCFRWGVFDVDVWGVGDGLGSIGVQVKDSMMVTLFCFFGVEGAVMLAARARRARDVGRAGVVGFMVAWVLYLLVSVLCFGLMSRGVLAELPNPSAAYILKGLLGDWAYYFVIGSVIVALLGGWVAWTLVVAQVPYEAAKVGIFPGMFKRVNRNGMPTFGLRASSVVMNLFLMIVVMADNVYLAALHVTGLMILPCYLFTGMFLWRKADGVRVRALAVGCSVFCLWMIYAGGLREMAMTSVFYICGIMFYIKDRVGRLFSRADLVVLGALTLAMVYSIVDMAVEGVRF